MRDDHSFLVPAYGDSPFLAGCVRSLMAQTTPSRIVICTSTPSDHIRAVADEAGCGLIVNPERRHIAGDWNFALAAATTPYVTLAHQDDTYEPEFLTTTLALFARRPEAALCFTGYQEIDDDGWPVSSRISRVKHLLEAATLGSRQVARGLPLRLFLSFGNPLPCSSVTFNRRAAPDFRFSEAFASNLDWEAWWRLFKEGRTFLHAPARLVGRRHNPLTETSRLIREGRRQSEDREMFLRIWPAPVAEAIGLVYGQSYR